ncbi:MAG: DUF3408 domain-containing protein [Tenacibaculum sp.]|nr:DUF3408 domain-containing protein [Tenacibaculum sp.]
MDNNEKIDEEALMSIMAEPFSVEGFKEKFETKYEPKKEAEKEPPKPKKDKPKQASYEELFLVNKLIKARDGKATYISKEHHERLLSVVHLIGNDNITLFELLNNIIEQQLKPMEENILAKFD